MVDVPVHGQAILADQLHPIHPDVVGGRPSVVVLVNGVNTGHRDESTAVTGIPFRFRDVGMSSAGTWSFTLAGYPTLAKSPSRGQHLRIDELVGRSRRRFGRFAGKGLAPSWGPP